MTTGNDELNNPPSESTAIATTNGTQTSNGNGGDAWMSTPSSARLDTTDGLNRYQYEPSNWQQMRGVADLLVKSGTLPKALAERGHAGVMTVLWAARELGLTAMQGIKWIAVVEGRPSLMAQGMHAVIQRSGMAEVFEVTEISSERCTVRAKRRGDIAPIDVTWTIQDAKRAGLIKERGAWEKYPRDMLRSRAISEAARMRFPAEIGGMYTPEETESTLAADAPVQEQPAASFRQRIAKLSAQAVGAIDIAPSPDDSARVDNNPYDNVFDTRKKISGLSEKVIDSGGSSTRNVTEATNGSSLSAGAGVTPTPAAPIDPHAELRASTEQELARLRAEMMTVMQDEKAVDWIFRDKRVTRRDSPAKLAHYVEQAKEQLARQVAAMAPPTPPVSPELHWQEKKDAD